MANQREAMTMVDCIRFADLQSYKIIKNWTKGEQDRQGKSSKLSLQRWSPVTATLFTPKRKKFKYLQPWINITLFVLYRGKENLKYSLKVWVALFVEFYSLTRAHVVVKLITQSIFRRCSLWMQWFLKANLIRRATMIFLKIFNKSFVRTNDKYL